MYNSDVFPNVSIHCPGTVCVYIGIDECKPAIFLLLEIWNEDAWKMWNWDLIRDSKAANSLEAGSIAYHLNVYCLSQVLFMYFLTLFSSAM